MYAIEYRFFNFGISSLRVLIMKSCVYCFLSGL